MGGALAKAVARHGASVAALDIDLAAAERVVAEVQAAGGRAIALHANVLSKPSLEASAEQVLRAFGGVDTLINAAGGAQKEATTGPTSSFFDLPEQAVRSALDLNFMGTFLACQVFGGYLVARGGGSILNIASVGGLRPLTRSVAYSAAKAAVISFTQWLAVHLSQEYGSSFRVNAIAPGWILSDQNRFLLVDEQSGKPTERGARIVSHTPLGRLGQPEEVVGPALMLLSETDGFIHGATVMVDGGFNAYGGV